MTNTYCLINSEGNIFDICFENEKITAKVLLEDGSGKISFEIDSHLILEYLNNEINLNDLLQESKIKTVELYDYKTKSILQINRELVSKLACGDEYYTNLYEGMKLPFVKRIELAVRANSISLDLKKIMNMIKHYYYLKQKMELLYYTFGNDNPAKIKCEKQLKDIRQHFMLIDIPLLFVSCEEIEKLNIKKICLKKDFNFDIKLIKERGEKDINNLTNKEMNYLAYHRSNSIVNLNRNPHFWSKKARNEYIHEHKANYSSFKAFIVIDNIFK